NTTGYANRYLKSIKYGNTTPYQRNGWLFQVVFDYGEHDPNSPTPDQVNKWPCRPDAFSSFRAGFEVRTYRLCQRVLMFHLFTELGNTPCLVRSTDLGYSENPITSYLTSITQTGYIRNVTNGASYERKSLPPLELTYSQPLVDKQVHFIDATSLENLPAGLDGSRYQWVDLDSEGIAGILTEQAGAWFYKRNLGDAHFAPAQLVATKPSPSNLQSGQQQLMDLAGDGQKYLVQFSPPLQGFYEHQEDGQWGPFTPFLSSPNIPWNDSNLKFIDLDGDGHSDILLSEDEVFTWYRSLARDGFESAETVRKPFDEEKGPNLVFADGTQSIYLANMTGDGLTDIIRIRNGEICYWPNTGYGRFAAKVTMDAAPLFDYPDYFDQKRIRLADIDGSGTTDIIYLGRDSITFWFNQSGNSWSEAQQLVNFPATDNLSSVTVIDLLGNGTACIVWSSPLPGDRQQPMRYIDLMSGQKPHLLLSINNNMGKVTNLQYAPSTKFYLADQAAGKPWITKLPFPVHVLERVETNDAVSGTRLVTTYSYHHGFYDSVEREFRGFGLVEQRDAESFTQFKATATSPASQRIIEEDLYVPPVHTKTWFHTGAYIDRQNISQHFATEYYAGDPKATLLPDTLLPSGLTAQEEQEASRALKGKILRQEIYAEDGSPQSSDPYSVSEHTYAIRTVQPLLANPHAVFYVNEQEAIEFHYERHPDDPRISHHMTLEVDAFGNVTKSATTGYPRRTPLFPEQATALMTYAEADFVNRVDVEEFYRIGVPSETRSYEITGIAQPQGGNALFTLSAILTQVQNAGNISYEVSPTAGVVQKRLIEHMQIVYYKDDLSGPLPLGQVESHALPYQTYKEALTPGLVTQVYGSRINDTLLKSEGGYIQQNGAWWVPSSRSVPDARQFYLPVQVIDPLGNTSTITYDSYALLIKQTKDPLKNVVQAENNYQTMLPKQVTEPNGNRSAVLFDALGMVVETVVMGKETEQLGDTIADPTTKLEYNLLNWQQNRLPNYVHISAREKHGAANPRWQETYSYSDGSGHEVMKKIQAEPGPALAIDAQGNVVTVNTSPQVRWVGTGRTIYDNKGNPVKKYEPYFSVTSAYETEQALVELGVTPILHYDPLGRLIRTDNPNGTFSKVEFDAWQQITSDENDAVLESKWYADRASPKPTDPEPADPETRAAWLAAHHANTPTIAHLDVLSRPFLTIADNGPDGKYQSHVKLDIEGNQLVITDARGNQAMVNTFDMLKHKLYTHSMDAGERWTSQNVVDLPMREWDSQVGDSQGHQVRHSYDALHRPTHLFVQQGTKTEVLAERIVYGEALPNAATLNLRGKPYQVYDGAGVVTNTQYDFKGNLLSSNRQLTHEYRQQVDWSPLASLTNPQDIATAAAPLLETETFTSSTTYDALNRPTSSTTPDQSMVIPTYNEANLLEKLDVRLRGATNATAFVKNLDYNAKGQRVLLEYGNNVSTAYTYDPFTFRLTNLKTTRTTDKALLQDLSYTYDTVGNITETRDNTQQTIFFNNAVVLPATHYIYDALYWLTQATGREHIGQTSTPPPNYAPEYDYNDAFRVNLPHPNDGQAMQNYSEQYQYDSVGNIISMAHQAAGNTWTRHYAYAPDSNRLQSTSLPGDAPAGPFSALYSYDIHGNMIKMHHLPQMQWDFKNQLHKVDLGGGGTAYYVYDAGGQRVRKVVESGSLMKERIYLGGYEIFRQRNGSGLTLERETLHTMDDKQCIALVETQTIDGGNPLASLTSLLRYQLGNHLGSAVLEADDSGAIISYEEYHPYGSTSYQAGRNAAEVSLKRYRYTGKERDEETGLYYYGARYYASWLGRWVSCDPKGMVDGVNLYDFVNNNSVKQVDQQGYQGEPEWKSMIMSIGTPFSHPPSEHDILRPTSPIYDVGATHNIHNPAARAVLNLGANVGRGIYNLVAMVVNLIPRGLGGLEDTAKSLGASQSDIDPVKFAISMMGPGEIEGATVGLGYLGTAVGAKLTELTRETGTLSETSALTGGFANTAAGLGEVAEADIAAASPLKPRATTSTVPRKGTGSPGSGGGGPVPLRHGTTLDRAQNILKSGPDPNFVQSGGGYPAGEFATAPTKGPYPFGSYADYARAKAGLFPREGGPAIVEVHVPQSIVGKAFRTVGEVTFKPGHGLEELRKVWSALQKTVKRVP
ncbi:MAG: toxin TcdB middle/N-terminal domain-containing protein, partial [Ktedonobacteraceae bacterium]